MRRFKVISVLILAGCASRTPVAEPTIKTVPPALIADSGASLYVFDGPDDWLEDGGDMLINPKPAPWMGVQGLRQVLKYGLSHKSIRFVGHADFQPALGLPTEVTLFNPESEAHLKGTEMRRVGFRVQLKAAYGKEAGFVDLEWTAEQLTDVPGPVGRDGKRGETRRDVEKISSGSGSFPLGAALLMRQLKWNDRVYFLLLRIVSLEKP